MELLLLLAIGFALRGVAEHVKGNYRQSRDQRVKEVAKSYPKGALPKSRQRSAARQHAIGWWAREARHGFPVTTTGWHAAWLAHQTVADHHKARREEAKTTALETRASVLKGMPDHKKRQAEAQKELDAIREQLAEWERQVPDVPPRGKRAVREAADEVARRRREKLVLTDTCPSCGAPDGYEHVKVCRYASAPPLPADSVRPAEPVVIDTPVRLHNAEDSAHLHPGEPRCEGCGGAGRNGAGDDACPVCRGWGSASVGPEFMPAAPAGTVCNACGRKGTAEDPVLIAPGGTTIHTSHAAEQHEAYAGALGRQHLDDGEIDDAVSGADSGFEDEREGRLNRPGQPWPFDEQDDLDLHIPCPDCGAAVGEHCKPDCAYVPGRPPIPVASPSPTTQGAPVTDTTYDACLRAATAQQADAEQNAAITASQHIPAAEQMAEGMQGLEVDAPTISAAMELVDALRRSHEAMVHAGEQAGIVKDALRQRHGGIQAAVDDAPIDKPAQAGFYAGR